MSALIFLASLWSAPLHAGPPPTCPTFVSSMATHALQWPTCRVAHDYAWTGLCTGSDPCARPCAIDIPVEEGVLRTVYRWQGELLAGSRTWTGDPEGPEPLVEDVDSRRVVELVDGRPARMRLGPEGEGGTDYLYAFDDAGRLVGMTERSDEDSRVYTTEYDEQGRILRTEVTIYWSRFHYDDQGRLVRVEDWSGAETRYAYDEQGRLLTVGNGNYVEHFAYDDQGRLASLRELTDTGKLHSQRVISRDRQGRVVQVEELERTVTFHYDCVDMRQ